MIYCAICGRAAVEDAAEAIENDWSPYYYEPGDETESGPICAECCRQHCEVGEDGELVRVTD